MHRVQPRLLLLVLLLLLLMLHELLLLLVLLLLHLHLHLLLSHHFAERGNARLDAERRGRIEVL